MKYYHIYIDFFFGIKLNYTGYMKAANYLWFDQFVEEIKYYKSRLFSCDIAIMTPSKEGICPSFD